MTPNECFARPSGHSGRPTTVTDGQLLITPWSDPVADASGFDPRSRYVEDFWLGTLGPTALLLLRRLVAALEHYPDGYELDLDLTACALGLGHRRGNASPFNRAFERCVMFGLAQRTADGFQVRRRVPELPRRHLLRFPAALQSEHDQRLAELRAG